MASRGVNKVVIIGNLGNDPETRYLPSGGAVTNITVATSESWKDKTTGQQQERTEWHRVSFFNKLAEIAGEYLRKGSKVYIEGQLRTRKWQDKDGKDCYTTEIISNEMQMLDSKPQDGQARPQGQQQHQQQQQQSQYAPQQNQQQQHQQNGGAVAQAGGGADEFFDDIPF